MVSVTLTIDNEIKSKMEDLSWVNWSELVREDVLKSLEKSVELEKFLKIISKSKFTEKDARLLSIKVKASMHKSLKDKGLIWMGVILDANILFRTLISSGDITELFFNKNLEIFAPEKLREEFLNNRNEMLEDRKSVV